MKYRILVFAVIAMLLMITSVNAGRSFYDIDAPVINTVAESITPYPVEPGLDFTVQLRVYNDGGERAENVSIAFIESDAFFLTGKDDDFDKPFSIGVGGSKDNLYYFTVLPDVKSGEYPITFKIKERNIVHEKKVFVRIIGEPDIIFNAVLLNNSIAPDGLFNAEFTIKNVGTGIARNIKLVPQTQGFVIEGSNLIFLDELKPNMTTLKNIQFMVSDSNAPGPQKLAFILTYKDEKSNEYLLEQSLGLKLLNKVKLDLAAVIVEPQPIISGKNAFITVRIENLGEGEAENVQVFLKNDGFEGQNKAYIGKLSEGEDAPAIFTLISSEPGKHNFTIKVTYEDDLGEHELSETLELLVREDNNYEIIFFAIILILIIGVLVYALFLKKGKK
ncbi:MAG: COG1361 S-layer family protein [Candidatus Aenigmarchaeota archaeon]|nr:COG1361 S-layer family protein [Candidatus Aenigmarchaeota archaeon]